MTLQKSGCKSFSVAAIRQNAGKNQRKRGKSSKQKKIEALRRHRLRDNVIHTQHVKDRNVRANLMNRAGDRRRREMRIGNGAYSDRLKLRMAHSP